MGKTKILSPLEIVFPPFCWHCDEPASLSHPLCSSCRQFLQFLPLASPLVTFEGRGPAWTLMQALKSGKAPHFAKGLAGIMALQYLRYLPLPDVITYVPQSLYRFLQIGYNPSYLLAHHLAKILDRPLLPLLKRKRQLYCQMKVEKEKRFLLPREHFQWKKRIPIVQNTVLLIDDVIGTGATLQACAQRLYEGLPLKIIKMACIEE